MATFQQMITLLRAKGWSLYKRIPGADLRAIIEQGKTTTIEPGVFYDVLPTAFRDTSFDELTDHMDYARHTNQLPVYNDRTNPASLVRGVIATANGVAIVPVDGGTEGGVLCAYEFDGAQAERAIIYNISNYNIHYFATIDEIADFVARNKLEPQLPSPLPGQLRWTYARRDENSEEVVIYPEAPSPFLFRGQVKRYEPCNPTVARDLKSYPRSLTHLSRGEQAGLIVNLIRTQWFVECLRETPLFLWMKERKVHMDETAVAQHYGLPTGYIDLSQSFEVASFFACCNYDRGAWTPATSGEGVIYVVDVRMTPIGGGPKPICLQPFPRPSEQWGWVHEVTLGDDFDKLPYVKKFIFRHNEQSSQRIRERFRNGTSLFPPDPMAVVADRIMQAQDFPLAVARKTIEDLIDDPQGLPNANVDDVLNLIAVEKNVTAIDGAVTIVDERTRSDIATAWMLRRDAFFSGIGFGLTRSCKP